MSRTKKDRPSWVKMNDSTVMRTAYHNHNMFGQTISTWGGKIATYADACTIDVDETSSKKNRFKKPCGYWLDTRYYTNAPKREDRLNTYYRPLRAMERDVLKDVAKEYNSFGDIENDITFPDSHQHCMLGGGYWD